MLEIVSPFKEEIISAPETMAISLKVLIVFKLLGTATGIQFNVFLKKFENKKNEIPSMPGVFRFSIDRISEAIDELLEQNVDKVILFGVPEEKDPLGSNTYSKDGIIQRSLRTLKFEYPQLLIITDVCLCEYTTHGHCGVIIENKVHNASKMTKCFQILLQIRRNDQNRD